MSFFDCLVFGTFLQVMTSVRTRLNPFLFFKKRDRNPNISFCYVFLLIFAQNVILYRKAPHESGNIFFCIFLCMSKKSGNFARFLGVSDTF